MGIVIASKLRPEHRPWLGRFPDASLEAVDAARQRWSDLRQSEREWRSKTSTDVPWPPSSEIFSSAETIGKGLVGTLVSTIGGSRKAAKEMTARLGLDEITAAELRELGSHVRALEHFLSDRSLEALLGEAWAGLSTPLDDIVTGLKVQVFANEKLSRLSGGSDISAALLRIGSERLGVLASHEGDASVFRLLLGSRDGSYLPHGQPSFGGP